jgi:uncharacterized membrane protein (DUF485 family)
MQTCEFITIYLPVFLTLYFCNPICIAFHPALTEKTFATRVCRNYHEKYLHDIQM